MWSRCNKRIIEKDFVSYFFEQRDKLIPGDYLCNAFFWFVFEVLLSFLTTQNMLFYFPTSDNPNQ